jgi:hypothetical protein
MIRPSFAAAAKQMIRSQTLNQNAAGCLPLQSLPGAPAGGTGDRHSGDSDGASGAANDAVDSSLDLRSEMAALLAYYASRIAAARISLAPGLAAAIVQALMNEQAVALRALTDRWHPAVQNQRDEGRRRPKQNLHCKDNNPKPY